MSGPAGRGRRRPSLIAIGDNCLDVFVDQDLVTVGGNALNVAVNWRRAGLNARYFGAVGDDAQARTMLAAIAQAGLDPADVERRAGDTAVTRLCVENGERRFLEESLGVGEAYRPTLDRLAAAMAADWVHLGTNANPDLVRALAASGVRFSVDLSTRPPAFPLEGVALAVASASEPDEVGPRLAALREAGSRMALVTAGRHGAGFDDGGRIAHVQAEPVEVVDTCGAGDSFIAAFVAAWGVGGVGVEAALAQAARAAAVTCGFVGGVGPGVFGGSRRLRGLPWDQRRNRTGSSGVAGK